MKKVSKLIICFPLLFLYAGTLHAAEYVAFSLKVAQERIVSTPKDKDFRKAHPEVFTIGGITAIRGLVYDRKNEDVILVGERDPERSILTLDDFVVALRARFIHGKWPLVSIDPTPETEKTQMQIVRFEGGIENTQFGQDLFDADYRLKKIGMGLLPSGVQGLETYWDLGMERAKHGSGGSHKIGSRFWFYPVLPSVTVREDVVAIKGLKVGVFTEVLSAEIDGRKIEELSTFEDMAGDAFAKGISHNFEGLAKVHLSFARLQGLDEMVALTRAIEELEERPDLSFWLRDFRLKKVKTKKEVNVLKREEGYELPRTSGGYRRYWLSGGVQLMAIALRLKAGDVTALKEAVLQTRPGPDASSWSFVVGQWLIPTSPGMLKLEDVAELFSHAVFLHEEKRYYEAISLYEKVLMLRPDSGLNSHAHYGQGAAYYHLGKFDKAIPAFSKALEINSKYTEALLGSAMSMLQKNKTDKALGVLDRMLAVQPYNARAWLGKGYVYLYLGGYPKALECFEKVLKSMPTLLDAEYGKAATLFFLGESMGRKDLLQESLNLLKEAIQSNPSRLEPVLLKAYILSTQIADPQELLETSERALSLINGTEELVGLLWLFKAQAESELGRYDIATKSGKKAMEMLKEGQPWLEQTIRCFVPAL